MQKFLTKIDRISAWTLLIGMLLYFISGYGMTKGIISASLATKLHISYLTYFVAIAFLIHTFYAVHLAFKRWRIWNNFSKTLLTLFYLFFISSFIYVDRYYGMPKSDSEKEEVESVVSPTVQNQSTAKTGTSQTTTPTSTGVKTKTFTLTELAKYNGANGQPAYVAVDGNVYNLTAVFANGKHFSHYAGTELTNAFYTRHAKSALAKYPIVGTLSK
jgi:predicted heme/steroid binding protein